MKAVYLLLLVIAACNANTSKDTSIAVSDTLGVVPDSTATSEFSIPWSAADTALLGFYEGVLPCKDCQGIKHTLLLKDSGRFKLEEFTLGRSTFPDKREGRWTRAGDSIRLMANQKIILTYHIEKDSLKIGYQEGNPIPDSVSKNYKIARRPDAAANAIWKKKANAGVDFYAMGTEPFWSLEMDKEKSIAFKVADLPKPLMFAIRAPRVNKDSTYYVVDSANSRLEVTVFNEFCSDGMSDNMYEYRVHVRYKGQAFKGCGTYLRK
jgi:uncharacterized membrane protein/uncharacterized lipoprotein NlpE involved in copper resistance